jgi:hypothetical protein
MIVVKAIKELIAPTPEIDCDKRRTVTSAVILLAILVKRGRLGEISDMPPLPLRGSRVNGM